jgi:hypothetical protein
MRQLVDALQEMKIIYGHTRKFTKIAYSPDSSFFLGNYPCSNSFFSKAKNIGM